MEYTFGFIGAGNMGGALAKAVTALPGQAVALTSRSQETARNLAAQLGCAVCENNRALAEKSQVIVLGVKPHQMGQVLAEIEPVLREKTKPYLLVSMAAGLTLQSLAEKLGWEAPMVRIMPNTPVAVGQGLILYTANSQVQPNQLAWMTEGFQAAGRLEQIAEAQMDAASAVAGCGPAFGYLFLEALADGAVACGLPRQQALDFAAQMLLGAAEMVKQTGVHPGALKDAVCSPGGSTIAGVRALEKAGLRSAAMEAVIASFEKTKELAKQ